MPTVYENGMGHIHIWKKGKCGLYNKKFETGELHNSLSTCNGKQSDVYIQNNPEQWKKRNLTSSQRKELEAGWPIFKKKLQDFDDN